MSCISRIFLWKLCCIIFIKCLLEEELQSQMGTAVYMEFHYARHEQSFPSVSTGSSHSV